ncbi:MAG: hypothetical protein Q7J32_17530 [Sphingomonadaceae bacterium]|nr:hypothetical protein [Sphingomonadaceae bacterium]
MSPTEIATALVAGGLVLALVGAIVAARGVMITETQADELAGTYWDENPHLRGALIRQSRLAQRGLWTLAAGTLLQIIGTAAPILLAR